MTLLDRIKEVSKKRGLSLRAVNEKANLGTNAIYRWDTQVPNTASVQAVAQVLGVSVDYLLGNDTTPPAPTKVDLADNTVILSYDGKEVSPEDRELILRLMRGAKHDN